MSVTVSKLSGSTSTSTINPNLLPNSDWDIRVFNTFSTQAKSTTSDPTIDGWYGDINMTYSSAGYIMNILSGKTMKTYFPYGLVDTIGNKEFTLTIKFDTNNFGTLSINFLTESNTSITKKVITNNGDNDNIISTVFDLSKDFNSNSVNLNSKIRLEIMSTISTVEVLWMKLEAGSKFTGRYYDYNYELQKVRQYCDGFSGTSGLVSNVAYAVSGSTISVLVPSMTNVRSGSFEFLGGSVPFDNPKSSDRAYCQLSRVYKYSENNTNMVRLDFKTDNQFSNGDIVVIGNPSGPENLIWYSRYGE